MNPRQRKEQIRGVYEFTAHKQEMVDNMRDRLRRNAIQTRMYAGELALQGFRTQGVAARAAEQIIRLA